MPAMPAVPTGTPCAAASPGEASFTDEALTSSRAASFGHDGPPQRQSTHGSHHSAVLFREKLSQLADEYEHLHAAVTRLRETRRLGIPEENEVEVVEAQGRETCREVPARSDSRDISHHSHPSLDSPEDAPFPTGSTSTSVGHSTEDSARPKGSNFRRLISDHRLHAIRGDTPITWIAQSPMFERFVSTIIVCNVVCLGISADMEMSDVRRGDFDTSHTFLLVLEMVFLAVYVVELAVRLIAYGRDFFLDEHDRAWNVFDMILVLQSIFEQASVSLNGSGAMNLSFLRAMRLFKIVKMLRVIRLMRSMKELRMILTAIIGSVRSMLWSLVLLVTVLFMFSLIFIQGFITRLRTANETASEGLDEDDLAYWGSVTTAMQTLFKSSTGGIDWDVALPAVSEAGGVFKFLFYTYIAFYMFVILNTVTALFVEATIASAGKDISSNIQNELEKKEEYVDSLQKLFNTMDSSGDGEVSLEEFLQEVSNPKLAALFSRLDIPISDAEIFFRILSNDGTTNVVLDQFVTACIRIRGSAQAIDLQDLIFKQTTALQEIRKTRKELHTVKHKLLEAFCSRIDGPTCQPSVDVGSVSRWRARDVPSIYEQTPALAPAAAASTLADSEAWDPELWSALRS